MSASVVNSTVESVSPAAVVAGNLPSVAQFGDDFYALSVGLRREVMSVDRLVAENSAGFGLSVALPPPGTCWHTVI